MLSWHGTMYETWLVTYRAESGLSLLGGSRPRGRLWVRQDGTVLQQEVSLMECQITFTRMSGHRVLGKLRDLFAPRAWPARPQGAHRDGAESP